GTRPALDECADASPLTTDESSRARGNASAYSLGIPGVLYTADASPVHMQGPSHRAMHPQARVRAQRWLNVRMHRP
ncbi:MAG: hypothetical protein ACYC6L_07875, partial [Anaerolineae bacterium]